jgi:TorA maturation chaperone TorD
MINNNKQRAEAYQILSQFFLHPPDDESLSLIRQDFSLESKEPLEEIAEDFATLLSYPDGSLQPIESLFIPAAGSPYLEVTDFYANAGLAIDEDYEVVPDHLSVELLFMSYLIDNGRAELEKKFLEEHLMNWVPYYCDKVAEQAKTLFYREIAGIVKDFLTAEYDEFTE